MARVRARMPIELVWSAAGEVDIGRSLVGSFYVRTPASRFGSDRTFGVEAHRDGRTVGGPFVPVGASRARC